MHDRFRRASRCDPSSRRRSSFCHQQLQPIERSGEEPIAGVSEIAV